MEPTINEPTGIIEVLSRGFFVFKETLYTVIPIAFLMTIVGMTPTVIHILRGQSQPPETISFNLIIIETLIFMVNILLSCIILHRIYGMMHKKETSIGQSLQFVISKLPIILVAGLIVWVITLVGMLLLIAPGAFAAVLLIMVYPCILFENAGIFGSIEQSVMLVWGNWWRTFIVILAPMVLIVIVALITATIAEQYKNPWIQIVANIVVMTILIPFFNSVLLSQYDDLKARARLKSTSQSI